MFPWTLAPLRPFTSRVASSGEVGASIGRVANRKRNGSGMTATMTVSSFWTMSGLNGGTTPRFK